MITAIPASDCRWLSQTGDDRPTGGGASGGPGEQPQRNPNSGVAAAYTLAGSVVAGLGIGLLIDRKAGTAPKWTIGMTLLFLGVGLYHLVREAFRK